IVVEIGFVVWHPAVNGPATLSATFHVALVIDRQPEFAGVVVSDADVTPGRAVDRRDRHAALRSSVHVRYRPGWPGTRMGGQPGVACSWWGGFGLASASSWARLRVSMRLGVRPRFFSQAISSSSSPYFRHISAASRAPARRRGSSGPRAIHSGLPYLGKSRASHAVLALAQ